jgi:hypothetical protein
VRWDGAALHLVRRSRPLTRAVAGPGLLLVPSAFTGPRVLTRVVPPEPPQPAYPARGLGAIWAPAPAAGTDALAAVLGRSRTRLLSELDAPASTTQLAARTGLSPAGVSQTSPRCATRAWSAPTAPAAPSFTRAPPPPRPSSPPRVRGRRPAW